MTPNYSLRPISLDVYRLVHPRWQRQPFSGEGARLVGGRWNPKGRSALYLSTDPTTATAEYYQELPRPGMLVPFRVEAERVADLTNGRGGPSDGRVEEALSVSWNIRARIENYEPPSWTLAEELMADGAEGALVPSAQNRGGTNLVLWRWHDARQKGDGAALSLLDPEKALIGR